MLVYIIDAFNVIHKDIALKKSRTPHCDFIRRIRAGQLTGSPNNRVIVVFDGSLNLPALNEKGTFEVYFGVDVSADTIIKKTIDRYARANDVLVVTDDREIRDYACLAGTRICRSSDFLTKKKKPAVEQKEISPYLEREINEQMRKIWLKE